MSLAVGAAYTRSTGQPALASHSCSAEAMSPAVVAMSRLLMCRQNAAMQSKLGRSKAVHAACLPGGHSAALVPATDLQAQMFSQHGSWLRVRESTVNPKQLNLTRLAHGARYPSLQSLQQALGSLQQALGKALSGCLVQGHKLHNEKLQVNSVRSSCLKLERDAGSAHMLLRCTFALV